MSVCPDCFANPCNCGPYVCPGCYAVGPEDCAPGCIDDEMRRDREEEYLDGPRDDEEPQDEDGETR